MDSFSQKSSPKCRMFEDWQMFLSVPCPKLLRKYRYQQKFPPIGRYFLYVSVSRLNSMTTSRPQQKENQDSQDNTCETDKSMYLYNI